MSRFDRERAAHILADAVAIGDKPAAERNGITERTLRNYRKRLQSDPELSKLFRAKKDALDSDRDAERLEWSRELRRAVHVGVAKARQMIEALPADRFEHLRDVVGFVKVFGELDITKRALGDDDEPSPDLEGEEAAAASNREARSPSGSKTPQLH